MRKTLFLLIMAGFILVGCYTHISGVKNRWGPPAKMEYRKNTIIHYYYFYEGRARAIGNRRWVSGQATIGWIVVEITTDLNGEILKRRKYWKQPDLK